MIVEVNACVCRFLQFHRMRNAEKTVHAVTTLLDWQGCTRNGYLFFNVVLNSKQQT
jgi:hypothetical protein